MLDESEIKSFLTNSKLSTSPLIKLSRREISTLLAAYDKDGNGFLSSDEIVQIINDYKNRNTAAGVNPELITILQKYDTDNDGSLDVSELNSLLTMNGLATIRLVNLSRAEILTILKKYDSDNSGHLSKEETEALLNDYKLNEMEHDLMSILKKFDVDGDGNIDEVELEALLTNAKLVEAPLVRLSRAELALLLQTYDTDKSGHLQKEEIPRIVQDYQFRKEKKLNPDLVRILKKYDADGNGSLDADELESLLCNNSLCTDPLVRISREEINVLLGVYDRDKNGFLQGDEVLAIVNDYKYSKIRRLDPKLVKILSKFDTNNDGNLDAWELSRILQNINLSTTSLVTLSVVERSLLMKTYGQDGYAPTIHILITL